MTSIDIANTTEPKIGDKISVEITTFVMGTIEAINADGSVYIRLDDAIRAVNREGARFPDPFWIECEDAQ